MLPSLHSLFQLRGSRCDQDSPNPLPWLFYFVFPFPFYFGRVQTLLWSLFLFWLFALLEPVAWCLLLPWQQCPFLLVSFAAVGYTTQTTSVTKLVLTG